MPKIAFIGAGSYGFTRTLVKDLLTFPSMEGATLALMDIDDERLAFARRSCERIIREGNYKAKVLATKDRREALKGADAVLCTILAAGVQVWRHDIEIPKKFGVDINIGDTRGPSGIFRALRTIPIMLDICRDMEDVAPNAILLNYTNPMAMLCGAMQRYTGVRTVGLCHSVQGCARGLLWHLGMLEQVKQLQWKVAGINHMAWLLEISDSGRDLYPEIKQVARAKLRECRKAGAQKHHDMVRLQCMLDFGYYITESSEHNAEYMPYWIKRQYPDLIGEFNIPLDEYPRRCINQIEHWKKRASEIIANPKLEHKRTHEYGSYIMEAIETDVPFRIGGNVLNRGLITNLPRNACVEVACMVDRNGVQPCHVGDLPEQCAALNRTNINVQLLTIEAAVTRRKEHIYHAAMLDPHTAAELSLDDIKAMCDELIAAHGKMLPKYT